MLTRLDTAAMNLFLAELSQAVPLGVHGVVLMDKAAKIGANRHLISVESGR